MNRYQYIAFGFLLYAIAPVVLAESGALPAPENPAAFFSANGELHAYIIEALENRAGLKASYADWQAALERIPQAGALEDPMFKYTQWIVTDETYFMVSLEQKFPWFGTRAIRREKAAEEAEAWLAALQDERNAVVRDVKLAYFDFAFLLRRLEAVTEQTQLLDESAQIARAQYDAGWSSEAEVLRIDQELARMNDMRRELEQMEPAARAALNAALGRPRDSEIPPPAEASYPADPPPSDDLDPLIESHNPILRQFDRLEAAGRTDVTLARRMNYPDITIGVDFARDRNMRRERRDPYAPGRLQTYRDLAEIATGNGSPGLGTAIDAYDTFIYKDTQRGAQDELRVMIGVNLPIWRKRIRAGVAEKEQLAEAARWRREDELRALSGESRSLRFDWDDAARRMALYGDELAAREELILSGLRAEYAAGSLDISILAMLESMRNILDYRVEFLRAERDRHIAAANLEYVIGAPWETKSPAVTEASTVTESPTVTEAPTVTEVP